jgi:hypothetical protein
MIAVFCPMKLRSQANLFLYQLLDLRGAKKQVIAMPLCMSRLACKSFRRDASVQEALIVEEDLGNPPGTRTIWTGRRRRSLQI